MGYEWMPSPGAGLKQQFLDYGNQANLGKAGKTAKNALSALGKGDYDSNETISNYLAPIRDQFSTMMRDSDRSYGMGALGLAGGVQPALMARLKGLNEDQIGENMGRSMSAAIPGMYSSFSNTFQNALNSKRGQEEFGLGGALNAANSGQMVYKKGFWDRFTDLLGAGAGIAKGAAGMFAGGAGGGAGAAVGGGIGGG